MTVAVALLATAFFWRPESSSAISVPVTIVHKPDQETASAEKASSPAPADDALTASQANAEDGNRFSVPDKPLPTHYEIKSGDTLSEILDKQDISANTLHKLLEADAEFLDLETLRPGTALNFTFDSNNVLQSIDLQLDAARTVSYVRTDDGAFEHQQHTKPLHWDSQLFHGDIHGSFYTSGISAGLDKGQVVQVSQLLKGKLNFRRDLRAGDTFSVIVGQEMTDTGATGNTRIDGIELNRGSKTYYAFLYDDGNYYDETGESVTPAFLRYPTRRHFRVSSPFDPYRLHPVTGRRAPHNGVDLAAPSGTPVMSTGDGIVTRIGNHPYAGKYVDIKHSGAFKTRYLHLSKILVKRGEAVKRGEKIALSGATGRVTGPHLHFEFHIKNHPVNPLTAKIPTSAKVPADKLADFQSHIRPIMARLNVPGSLPSPLASGANGQTPATTDANDDWTRACLRPGQCRYQ
ncbi:MULTISPECIES: peptidoglycan DD-metalloendopeptidase family protein [Marinobacter]|uniref:peptidoglycan DD-metalloendopeptidase family protein n=1 Tax=Marinobacter TaxID=2742 RepID=UPI001D1790BE|nr:MULTISPECIES: peptidoglycan DD-metalloendopeptidase family protein [Marinobacter]